MNKLQRAAEALDKAQALIDKYGGEARMPAAAKTEALQLAADARRLREEYDREPVYDRTYPPGDPGGKGARMYSGADDYDRLEGRPSADLAKAERLDHKTRVVDWCAAKGITDGDLERDVSPDAAWGSWFKGYTTGDWSEFRQMTKDMGTGTGGDGGFLVPTVLSARVIDLLRADAPLFAAGAQTVPMTSKTLDIARVAADVDATAWHAEHAPIVATKPTLEKVTFTAHTLPVLVKASRELAEDAPNAGQVVARSIAGATAVELTRAALRGDGSNDSPTGILNQDGVNTTAVGGPATWTTLANAIGAIRGRNDEPNGYISAPRTQTALELQADTTNQFIPPPPSVAALSRYTTTAIPTDLGTGNDETETYVANWRRLLIGMRVQLRIEPLRERFADNGQVAWLSWLRADVQLEHPASFQILTGVDN